MGFGKSKQGQQLFSVLDRLNMSLRDWAAHDILQQRYLIAAVNARLEREQREQKKRT